MSDADGEAVAGVAAVGDAVASVLCEAAPVTTVMGHLRELVPYEAAMLSAFDPVSCQHRPLAKTGYDETVTTYANGPYQQCPSYVAAMKAGEPMRMRDFAIDFHSLPTYRYILGPAGFQEGLTLTLRHPETKQHVGLLVLSQRDPDGIDDQGRAIIRAIGPMLAHVVDVRARLRMRPLNWAPRAQPQ